MNAQMDAELLERLRKYFDLTEEFASDEEIMRLADKSVGGSSVRLGLAVERLRDVIYGLFKKS